MGGCNFAAFFALSPVDAGCPGMVVATALIDRGRELTELGGDVKVTQALFDGDGVRRASRKAPAGSRNGASQPAELCRSPATRYLSARDGQRLGCQTRLNSFHYAVRSPRPFVDPSYIDSRAKKTGVVFDRRPAIDDSVA